MSVSTRIDSALGPVSTNGGTGLSIAQGPNAGFAPFKVDATTALTSAAGGGSSANYTMLPSDAGVITLNQGPITVTMPTAATTAGAIFTLRSLSTGSHVLTCSQETNGTVPFCLPVPPFTVGSKLTLSGAIGASVSLMSDGVNFLVLSFRSGSVNGTNGIAISGT